MLLAVTAGAGKVGYDWWTAVAIEMPLLGRAVRGTLKVTVVERGNLESTVTVDGVCEVEGWENKIVFIVPEGTVVKAGDTVVRIDTERINKQIAEGEIHVNEANAKVLATEQEIEVQRNAGESEVAKAELELTLAELDLQKFDKGDRLVELNDQNGKIAQMRFELEKLKDELGNLKSLVKKGYRVPEQQRQKEEDLRRAEFFLDRDTEKLKVIEEYEHVRKMAELDAKAKEATRALARAKATGEAKLAKLRSDLESARAALTMRQRTLEELRQQLAHCEIVAKQGGVVAYANEEWWSSDRQIREGAMVHARQKLFSLPDMSQMQVKVNVHESQVKRVKPGQKAAIRVDAFSELVLEGTVKQVSPLADSTHSWMSGGVKEYTTIVTIDKMPDAALKPGMTAEVEILVNQLSDVVLAPVQAVTERQRQHYAYVLVNGRLERRQVSIGDANERQVEIVAGLAPDEELALDARNRLIADLGEVEESPVNAAAPPATAQTNSAAATGS
ncbi:MAG: efflux RND transporter periplasmic adaptor subunit [Pirellulales bacterium]|nr:efflux RND transporter periplasmic adaptor subunit [Pirellulales bacterium]